MENEMAANEQNMKIKVEELKVEREESVGIQQKSWGLEEGSNDESTDRIVGLQRIKEEHNFDEAGSNIEVLEMQAKKIKVEENWEDCQPFEPIYITEEGIFKHENDFVDGNIGMDANSSPEQKPHLVVCKKESDELYSCCNCDFTTTYKYHLIKHMKEHRKQNRLDPHRFEFICIHCQAIFASKRNLDDHKVRIHPHSIPTVTSTIYQCTYCEYRSVLKGNFGKHMLKHSETANNYTFQTCLHCNAKFKSKAHLDRHLLTHPETPVAICSEIHMSEPPEKMNYNKFKVCVHCNGKFKNKASLDDHTIREHPGVVAYFSRQIHECAECPYKTFSEVRLSRHMVKHTKPVGSYNFSICIRCNTKYRSKQLLDEHIIRKHPDSIASVSSKIHECTRCTYQTAFKAQIAKHMALKHSETVDNYNYKVCVHCDAKFKSNFALANHTIKKHPDYMGSVCHKIFDCALCPYKTVLKTHLDRHMLKHPECAASHNLIKCVHCDATYKSKQTMDDHIVRVHPKFIASISSKVHECKYCAYKTTAISNMKTHTIQHTKVSCMHCNLTFKSRTILDEHIIGKHPDFLASISGKLHECSHCTYKTVRKTLLYRHMLKHPDINS